MHMADLGKQRCLQRSKISIWSGKTYDFFDDLHSSSVILSLFLIVVSATPNKVVAEK